jgi:hypothetical protein
VPLLTTCQLECSSTSACQSQLNTSDVECMRDAVACPSLAQCCRPATCSSPGTSCPGGGRCCPALSGAPSCCATGQVCAPGGGCMSR